MVSTTIIKKTTNMKKNLSLTLLTVSLASTCLAQNNRETITNDSTKIPSLKEIIEAEKNQASKKDNEIHYKSVWGKTTFINLSYINTKLSSDNLPTDNGSYSGEYKSSLGFGFLLGHTFNFHSKPIGSVMFVGLDLTPVDFNFNVYDKEKPSVQFVQSSSTPYSLPWHNKKMTLDYGISVGPSLTFYPFTNIGKSGTDNIRIHLYFHVGYSVGIGIINNVKVNKNDDESEMLWGHGLFTRYGLNISWDFIGIGYEAHNFSNFTYRPTGSDFKTGNVKTEQTSNRIYLQFRF